MRDYSFGNFISAIRERRGLSQYQLGALVGVSDKAVSKWENGASKPRIGTIRKLSEVLDVSIDELLTCEYVAFDKERKDLFAMKNEIIDKARNKIRELYGDNPPMRIANRFKSEVLMLDGQEVLLWMGFFGKLQEEFSARDLYFTIRGAQMGASFIAWLLGGTNVNPLPPHYYCPICKKVEFVSDEKCGMDLPGKKCFCGKHLKKDGFDISEVNMYPLCNYNEISVSGNATPYLKKCLQKYFEGYGLIRELRVISNNEVYSDSDEQFIVTRYALMSKEIAKKYPEEIISLQSEEYCELRKECSMLTAVEIVNEHINGRGVEKIEFTPQLANSFFQYMLKNGMLKEKYTGINLEQTFSNMENPKFNELLSLYGFLHGTGVWENNGKVLYNNGIPLEKLIASQEDVYAYLYDKLNGKYCENPLGIAFELKEAVCKGQYSRNGMQEETESLLLACGVPVWYVESMKKIQYLFPKTHLIAILLRDICKFIDLKA